jgi:hypothetical protein
MKTADFAIKIVGADIEDARERTERAVQWMERMSRELAEAVRDGRDSTCQMSNLTSAVCDLSAANATLHKYQTVLKFLEDVKNG